MKKSYHSSEAPTSPAPSSLRHSLLSIRPVPARSGMTSSLPTISLGGGLPSALAPDSVDRFATTNSAGIAKFAPLARFGRLLAARADHSSPYPSNGSVRR